MKISVKTYIISGTVALLAILIYSYVPQSIPVDPNGKTSQPNKSESGVAKSENATLEKSNVSLGSRKNPLIDNKEPKLSNSDQGNKIPPTPTIKEPELTRKQLTARALVVEKQANKRLDELTEKLNLTEEQQDFIFPILAKSLPTFHPSLNPDGNNLLSGIKTRVEPGSPVPDVEAEIYSILDEDQKMILEEEALDREAWWDDVVALLDDESKEILDKTTPETEKPLNSVENGNEPISQKEREEKAAKNKIDDFSRLLRNN
jgi:hypothetical protein